MAFLPLFVLKYDLKVMVRGGISFFPIRFKILVFYSFMQPIAVDWPYAKY